MIGGSFQLNTKGGHRPSLGEQGRIVVFETDFSSYHLAYVQAGIRRYFAGGTRGASHAQLTTIELVELFGESVLERVAVIGCLRNPESIAFFERNAIPCLNLNDQGDPPSLGFMAKICGEGVAAAEYFLDEAKLESLAFVGNTHASGHARRLREFSGMAAKRRVEVQTLIFKTSIAPITHWSATIQDMKGRRKGLRSFLSALRKPVGIFCGDDRIAMRIYYTAELMDIHVPEEMSILAIGSADRSKDPWAHVSSIVQLDHHQLGYAAARLMDEYLSTGKPPESVTLAPAGICHSQTTYRRAVGDSIVRQALMLIQQDPSLDVPTVCKRLKLSRQAMDIRFRRASNTTLSKAIEIERFIQAKRLVGNPNYSLDAIAAMAGYPNRRSMRRSFYRFTQKSPQEFRGKS